MRELKFRIWSCEEHRYIYSDEYVEFYEFFEMPAYFNPDECEQYIGLKDKDGKEIYEGDIVVGSELPTGDGKSDKERETLYYTIVWNEETAGFKWESFSTNFCAMYSISKGFRIVGNIHEPPIIPSPIKYEVTYEI